MSSAIMICPHECDKRVQMECRHHGEHKEGLGCDSNCNVGSYKVGGCRPAR